MSWVSWLSVGTASIASVVVYRLFRAKPVQASYSCNCGKVHLKLNVGRVSLLFPKFVNRCHCTDCVQFVEHCVSLGQQQGAVQVLDPKHLSIGNLVLYKRDVVVDRGSEHIEQCVMLEGGMNTRLYATCCNTPLGLMGAASYLPLLLLYPELLSEEDRKKFGPPTGAFDFASAPEGALQHDLPQLGIVGGAVRYFVPRILYGMLTGYSKPSPFPKVEPNDRKVIGKKKTVEKTKLN